MRGILAGFCLVAMGNGGIISSDQSWMKEMEAATLPPLTPEQQMHLFGGKVSMSGPPPKSPWWKDVEEGNLPEGALTSELKMELFGTKVTVKADDKAESPRSFDDFVQSQVIEFQSPFSDKVFSLKLGNLYSAFSDKMDVEGRGRLKKILIPVLLAMTIIAAIVVPALMTIIKLIAVKGLWSGVVSLILSKMLGLKALLNHHHHHTDEGRRPYFVYLPHGKHRRYRLRPNTGKKKMFRDSDCHMISGIKKIGSIGGGMEPTRKNEQNQMES